MGLNTSTGSCWQRCPVDVFNPTFKLTDEPGTWFDTGLDVVGGRSLAPVLKLPGVPTKATFIVGPETGTNTAHTVTSLIRPVGAAPFDQASGFVGTKEYDDHRARAVRVHVQDPPVHARRHRRRRPDDRRRRLRQAVDRQHVQRRDGRADVLRPDLPAREDVLHRDGAGELAGVLADRARSTWDPTYPPAPILTYKEDGSPALLPTLDGFFQSYFDEPKVLPPGNEQAGDPRRRRGLDRHAVREDRGQVQARHRDGDRRRELDGVEEGGAAASVNMNNPHNMWTDKDQKVHLPDRVVRATTSTCSTGRR